MSDGYSEECRRQERYLEKMRARLIEEDLLYGDYNPENCPNLQMTEDPFCVPGGRLFGECGLMWCLPCHAFLGPWGAWRAVVGDIVENFVVLIDVSARHADRIVAGVHLDLSTPRTLAAVGWSP